MSQRSSNSEQRRPDRAALVIAAILGLAAIGIFYGTSQQGGVAGYSPVGPKTVPYIIAAALAVLGDLHRHSPPCAATFRSASSRTFRRCSGSSAAWRSQMLTMRTVGFSIATGLLFAATAKGFGRGPLWMTIPIGIVFSFIVWFIFAKGLQLSLPAGRLEQFF